MNDFNGIFQKINDQGFHISGCTRPVISEPDRKGYRKWILAGYAGEMKYMERHLEACLNPLEIMPGVRSMIILGVNYRPPEDQRKRGGKKYPGKVSAYARGLDYHRVIKKKLKKICQFIKKEYPGKEAYGYTDTAPILEKALARSAGLGFMGKNTLLISKKYGSMIFLAVIMTTLKIQPSEPDSRDCGSCTACIDACPTSALVSPYVLDARKCISYLTIEYRGKFSEDTNLDGWIMGCDICQDVCPHNRNKPSTDWKEFHPEMGAGEEFDCTEWKRLEEKISNFNKTPLKRPGIDNLQRNMLQIMKKI